MHFPHGRLRVHTCLPHRILIPPSYPPSFSPSPFVSFFTYDAPSLDCTTPCPQSLLPSSLPLPRSHCLSLVLHSLTHTCSLLRLPSQSAVLWCARSGLLAPSLPLSLSVSSSSSVSTTYAWSPRDHGGGEMGRGAEPICDNGRRGGGRRTTLPWRMFSHFPSPSPFAG